MADEEMRGPRASGVGDAAVDGLLHGLAAGVAMSLYLVAAGLLQGESAGVTLGRFAAEDSTSPSLGAISHLAASAAYGSLFGLLWWITPGSIRARVPGWLAGLGYAFLVLMLAVFVILPGSGSPLQAIHPLHFAAAHLIYGLVLGLFTGRTSHGR